MSKSGDKIAARVEAQGFRVRRTRKGFVAYAKDPSGPTVGWHLTPSDHRAIKNLMASLRRIGVEI